MLTSVYVNPNSFAALQDAGGSLKISPLPATADGLASIDVAPGTYAVYQAPAKTGPWSAVPGQGSWVVGMFPPAGPAGAAQTAVAVIAGTGAPNNAWGADGWLYYRSDGGAGTTIYQRRTGAWVGIV